MLIPINISAYTLNSPQFSPQTCINFYPSVDQLKEGGKRDIIMYPTEGLTVFAQDTNKGSCRAQYEIDGEHYAILGDTLYQVSNLGALTSRGTLGTSDGYCQIISNKTQLMIRDGSAGYYLTRASGSVTQITDPDFNVPGQLTYQDGYGIYIKPGTPDFYISNLNDFSNWAAIDFSSVSSIPNDLVGLFNSKLELYLFTSVRAEVWINTGAGIFPWERSQNVQVQFGLAATNTIATLDNSTFFLGRDETGTISFIRMNGYQAVKISSEAIDSLLNDFTDVTDSRSFAYGKNGHLFYVTNFPSAGRTLVYDVATNKWHERKSEINSNHVQGRWLADNHVYINNQHYVGDYKSGTIYKLDDQVYTDNGNPILRELTSQVYSDDDERFMTVNELQFGAEVGVGLTTGQGNNPQIMLEISKDSGRTFGAQRFRSLGKIGEYKNRVKFNSLGHSRNWVFRIKVSDPIYVSLFDIKANIEYGDS